MDWGQVLRSCYGRKAGLEFERDEADKLLRRAKDKTDKTSGKGSALASTTDQSSGMDPSDCTESVSEDEED